MSWVGDGAVHTKTRISNYSAGVWIGFDESQCQCNVWDFDPCSEQTGLCIAQQLAFFWLLWHSYLRTTSIQIAPLQSHLTHFCLAQGSCIEARSLENRGQPLAWKTNPILVSRLIPRFEYFCYEMIWIPNTSGQLNHGNFVGSEAPRPSHVICTLPRN